MKTSGIRFFVPWVIQALRVFLTDLPIVILNTIEDSEELSFLDFFGWSLWTIGFIFEVVADAQKFIFRNDPRNHDKFITSGLWRYSQHPNYLGEILMWSAICVSATAGFRKPSHLLGWLSPVFTYYILIHVSGIPMLKAKADKKWKGNPEYERYIAHTPLIIPGQRT
eukprot:CAMPEP_0170198214 /NCGR_PEP_ID=MMETSP0040_2-20121228/68275_1 /TAXON_ID=641309 /ORGANISM="Lotharella oceanica, Strain CCMP622" /LENGTH=166 /DNA_ID=CAMNT_0010448099 /DNA_START=260 /DNA_END=760 /DNA_ORIENTATION=+